MATQRSGATWGDEVVRSKVNGHPCLMYRDRPRRITAVLEEARRWSDRVFLSQGDRSLTFAEHEALVRVIAARLRDAGVGPGERVGIFAANSPEWVAAFFAVLVVGAVAVPCNGWWSAEEMAAGCTQAEPTVVICDAARRDKVPAGMRVLSTEELGAVEGGADQPDVDSLPFDLQDGDENDPAVILFTAGTTQFPKGAVLTHRALVANLQTLLLVSRKLPHQIPDDLKPSVALVGLPLFHIGAIQLILVPLITGSRVVFLQGRFEAATVLGLMESERVTMFSAVPAMVERLLAHPDARTRELRTVRTIVLGGAPVDDGLLERIHTVFTGAKRGLGRTYGLTEAGGVVSTGVGAQIDAHPGSSGKLAPVVEVRIENPDDDGNGSILVRSPAAMEGYLGHDKSDVIDAEGWLQTGDLGRVDEDGYLYITGRSKEVIIRGGENISSARVEAVLMDHAAVLEVAVVGLPHEELGEVAAAIVVVGADADSAGLIEELRAHAAARLAHFAVPERWWIRSEPLPVNDSGKVLKNRLTADWQGT